MIKMAPRQLGALPQTPGFIALVAPDKSTRSQQELPQPCSFSDPRSAQVASQRCPTLCVDVRMIVG